jgi:hypothetical protein
MTSRPSLSGFSSTVTAAFVAILTASPTTPAFGQSPLATVAGTVKDPQQIAIPAVSVTLKSLDTGQVRLATTDTHGRYRIAGVAPARYDVTFAIDGFAVEVRRGLRLAVGEEALLDAILAIRGFTETVIVDAGPALVEPMKSALGRTIRTREIDEIPIANRDFAGLAVLVPGIASNSSPGPRGSSIISANISANGQTWQNNTFLTDGLSLDDTQNLNARRGLPLDAIQEFAVLSSGFTAEYGQASGAAIAVVTKSGTNRLVGRGFYFHRDDHWDATPGSVKLTSSAAGKPGLRQEAAGGFEGGPLVHDRAFFFGSVEQTLIETETVITSPVLQTFRPGAGPVVPQRTLNTQVLGKADMPVRRGDLLTARYRLDRLATPYGKGVDARSAPERAQSNYHDRNQDVALLASQVPGASALSEIRLQFAERQFGSDPLPEMAGYPSVTRSTDLLLGPAPGQPNLRRERRWQLVAALTKVVSDRMGGHTFKGGADVSLIDVRFDNLLNRFGVFSFDHNLPFDSADARTYPSQYRRVQGEPLTNVTNNLYAVFVQDQWRPRSNVTGNIGVRWDVADSVGLQGDRNNIAPRIGLTFDPWRSGRTVIRGSVGRFFDEIPMQPVRDALQARTTVDTLIQNPGYSEPFGPQTDPFGPNLNRIGAAVNTAWPSTFRLSEDLVTPFADQASVGVQHALFGQVALSIDAAWARGSRLLMTLDRNYPNLESPAAIPPRPDARYQQINTLESIGHSRYRALQVGVEKRSDSLYGYTVAYTLSSSERDTEDPAFAPQDHRNPAADFGPAGSDARHRLAASLTLALPGAVQIGTVLTARSGLPYNITAGRDLNRDAFNNDRPPDGSRNSARGDDFWQVDARVSKTIRIGRWRVQALAEAYNLSNHRNWTEYQGNMRSPVFGKPTNAASPRQVQVGVRVDF